MKKLYLLLVMLCVAVASSADVNATFLANSGNHTVTNGKGFLWNHTAYEINVGQVGDLAAADLSALSDATNPSNKFNMNNGTYFVIKGKLNPSDMAAIDSRLGSSDNPVYIDFAQAQFVDAEGNDITDGSLIANMNNSKVKYVVLPDNTTEINSEGWPATVEEAIAVNSSINQFLGYATYDGTSEGGAGTLEHLIAFDHRAEGNENIFNYTLSGTYWHQSEKYNADDYKNVFYLLSSSGIWNKGAANIKNLDLKNATMLSYGEIVNRELIVDDPEDNILNSETWPDRQDMSKYAGTANRREGLPTPDGTPAGTYDGLKNFILAAGYPEEGEEQTPHVQKIDHIKKDVWYTMCFPFDLTDDQLESCFGAGYEVAQFCGVVENDEKTGIILQFTDAVTPDANGVVTKAHVPYMIHPNSMAVNEDGTPKETVFTLTGVKETQEMHDADQNVLMEHAVTQFFNGTPFTFVGYGHNYLPSQVLIPQFAYFLGTKKGETYPRFFRQTGANDRASKSYWNKNIAVVLPGVDKNDASTINFSKIDSRVINSETEGKQVYEVWNYAEGYYNYICNEYKYVPTASASGVKSLANFDLQIVHTPLTETQSEEATAIEAVENANTFVAADKFGKVYNISGQYVGKDLNNLPKGVYILNGKKYMVK